jgi:hypothetical protein
LVYNFPIYRLDHFSSKNWRESCWNGATRNWNHAGSQPRATSCAWPRRAAPPADRTRLLEHRYDRRSQRFCTDIRTQSVLATRCMLTGRAKPSCAGQPTASPPYARSAAPDWLLAVAARTALVPCRNPLGDDSRDPLHKARAPIKELTSPPRALPHTEPPLPPLVVLTVNSTSSCFSSQTRAAPNSTRVPSSSPLRVLLSPSL